MLCTPVVKAFLRPGPAGRGGTPTSSPSTFNVEKVRGGRGGAGGGGGGSATCHRPMMTVVLYVLQLCSKSSARVPTPLVTPC